MVVFPEILHGVLLSQIRSGHCFYQLRLLLSLHKLYFKICIFVCFPLWNHYTMNITTRTIGGMGLDKPSIKHPINTIQGLSQDWEFTSPKYIIKKGWVFKMFVRYARYSILVTFLPNLQPKKIFYSPIINYWATNKHTKLHKNPKNVLKII